MQTTLTVPVKNAAQVNAIMAIVQGDAPAGIPIGSNGETTANTKTTRAPKKTAAKVEEPKEETSDIDMSDLRDASMTDVGSDDPADFEEGGDDFSEEPEAPAFITADELKNKLLPALNAYNKKNGKEKTHKVLKQFAATSKEVKQADLPKILKLLKV